MVSPDPTLENQIQPRSDLKCWIRIRIESKANSQHWVLVSITYIIISMCKSTESCRKETSVLLFCMLFHMAACTSVHCSFNCFSFLSFEPVFHLGCLPISSIRTKLRVSDEKDVNGTNTTDVKDGTEGAGNFLSSYRYILDCNNYRTCYTLVRTTRVPTTRDSLFYETKL